MELAGVALVGASQTEGPGGPPAGQVSSKSKSSKLLPAAGWYHPDIKTLISLKLWVIIVLKVCLKAAQAAERWQFFEKLLTAGPVICAHMRKCDCKFTYGAECQGYSSDREY
jgi:hypothetical protein